MDSCREMGVRGYLIDGEDGLVLMTSAADAAAIGARFGTLAFTRMASVRARELPDEIRRLSRKVATTSRGRIDGCDGKTKIWGWFHPDRVPGREIQIFRGGERIGAVSTDVFRPDLFEAGVGDGVAGFICSLPDLASRRGDVTIRNLDGDLLDTWTDPVPSPATPATPAAPAERRSVATTLGAGELPGAEAAGHYSVDLGRFALDYFLVPGKTKRMIVFSPGFLDAGRFPYPYFQRMKWAQQFEDTCVFLTDPTLLLGNTQIGWFIGDRTTHYLPVVARYLETLAASRGTAPAEILFFGSSAGGFSSIALAAHVRGARALAVNPQTNGLKLHSPSQLTNTLRSCLAISSLVDAYYGEYKERFVLSEMLRRLEYVPRMTIWQNFYDRYHVEHHLLPFLHEIKDLAPTEELDVHIAARPDEGHEPPNLAVIKHLFWP